MDRPVLRGRLRSIDEQLGALDELEQGDLAALNDRLAATDLGIVGP